MLELKFHELLAHLHHLHQPTSETGTDPNFQPDWIRWQSRDGESPGKRSALFSSKNFLPRLGLSWINCVRESFWELSERAKSHYLIKQNIFTRKRAFPLPHFWENKFSNFLRKELLREIIFLCRKPILQNFFFPFSMEKLFRPPS